MTDTKKDDPSPLRVTWDTSEFNEDVIAATPVLAVPRFIPPRDTVISVDTQSDDDLAVIIPSWLFGVTSDIEIEDAKLVEAWTAVLGATVPLCDSIRVAQKKKKKTKDTEFALGIGDFVGIKLEPLYAKIQAALCSEYKPPVAVATATPPTRDDLKAYINKLTVATSVFASLVADAYRPDTLFGRRYSDLEPLAWNTVLALWRIRKYLSGEGWFVDKLDGGGKCMKCWKSASTKCTACKRTWYCSRECQKADWPIHKMICNACRR